MVLIKKAIQVNNHLFNLLLDTALSALKGSEDEIDFGLTLLFSLRDVAMERPDIMELIENSVRLIVFNLPSAYICARAVAVVGTFGLFGNLYSYLVTTNLSLSSANQLTVN